MRSLLRHPYWYLAAHWTVTGALAAALLLPHSAAVVRTAGDQARTVTLLTGQIVHLNADGSPRPATNLLEGQLFGPDEYALPASMDPTLYPGLVGEYAPIANLSPDDSAYGQDEAIPFLGTFNPQLFDVSYLEANGYDDASTDRIPVIVRFDNRQDAQRAVRSGLLDGGIHLTHAFEYVPDAMGYVSKRGPFVPPTPDLTGGVQTIYLDAREQIAPDTVPSAGYPMAQSQAAAPTLAEALPLIGADIAHKRGLTGKGIKIAIVDSGIDAQHPDLAGRVVAAHNFSTDDTVNDQAGHGTHVAGTAAGTGAASDGKYGGVAPQAELINAKALNRNGSGSMSSVMQAMEWAADQGARVENLSLGSGPGDGTDPVSQLVNAITAQKNVLFAIAAGNSGPQQKVSAPAAADAALAVGAIDKQRVLAPFSSRGPRLGDMAVKPDIVAPGVRITAPRANPGSGDPYMPGTGTSMAAPMVAGAAALAMQLHPDWSALTIKDALMSSAAPLGDDQNYVSIYDQGAGVVNLANLIDLKVLIQPANVSFGVVDDEHPGIKIVRFLNLSDHPYTVDLLWRLRIVSGSGWATMTMRDRGRDAVSRVTRGLAGLVPLSADQGSVTTSTPMPQITLPPSNSFKGTFIVMGGGSGEPITVSGEILVMRDGQTVARAAAGFTIRGGGG